MNEDRNMIVQRIEEKLPRQFADLHAQNANLQSITRRTEERAAAFLRECAEAEAARSD